MQPPGDMSDGRLPLHVNRLAGVFSGAVAAVSLAVCLISFPRVALSSNSVPLDGLSDKMMDVECPGVELCGSDVGSDTGADWTDARESLTIESASPTEPLSSEFDEVFSAEDGKSDTLCNGTEEAIEELEQDDNFVVDSLGKIATEVSFSAEYICYLVGAGFSSIDFSVSRCFYKVMILKVVGERASRVACLQVRGPNASWGGAGNAGSWNNIAV
jgi:hypothetical protein